MSFAALALAVPATAAPLPKIHLSPDSRGFESAPGKPFVPFGLTYYRPGTGWAPQVWKQWDADATRKDFAKMKELGVNCVRVFLSYGSFFMETNRLSADGLQNFDQFLEIAEQTGIYVHPTGPDHWEGTPDWAKSDRFADEAALRAIENFWRQFAARYRGRAVIIAYDLLNEPAIAWDTPPIREKWNRWLEKKYSTLSALSKGWSLTNQSLAFASVPIPARENCADCPRLLDFQHFRESLADDWTRRQVTAIKTADPQALVTVGLIQWSVPSLIAAPWQYAAFRPDHLAPLLDFLEIHFYPLARGFYQYSSDDEAQNLAYLEGMVREVARPGKPVVIAEFGWYGGGSPTYGKFASATEQQQTDWCRKLIESTAGLACGWLNWGFHDHPQANDVSQLTGLLTVDGKTKAWGREFKNLSTQYSAHRFTTNSLSLRPTLDWDLCTTSAAEGAKFRERYLQSWRGNKRN